MPRTIIKTGCVLQCATGSFNEYDACMPPMYKDQNKSFFVYGDLHVVGNCCVMYMPPIQIVAAPVHGLVSLVGKWFWRRSRHGEHDASFVVPADRIRLKPGVLCPHEFPWFQDAGGSLWDVA